MAIATTTFPTPPRLTGNYGTDMTLILGWMNSAYRELIVTKSTVNINATMPLVYTPAQQSLMLATEGVTEGQVLGFHSGVWQAVAPGTGGVETFNTRSGDVTLLSADVSTALGYVPGQGSVQSVGLVAPAEFSVSGSPVTNSGNLTFTKAVQGANTFWCGPTTGAAAAPAFRAIVGADIPTLNQNTTGQAGTVATINGLLASGTNTTLSGSGTAASPYQVNAPAGTVVSVGLSLPAEFTVSGSPVTGSGTLTATKATQTKNTFWCGPTTGAAAQPAFRAIVAADIPTLNQNTSGSSASCTGASATVTTINANLTGGNSNTLSGTGTSGSPYAVNWGPLATVTGINGKTVANTTIYTVPAGKTLILLRVIVRCTAASSITIPASAGVGFPAGTSNVFASTSLTSLTATTALYQFSVPSGAGITVPALSVLSLNIGTGATGTSQTLAVDLIGYLV